MIGIGYSDRPCNDDMSIASSLFYKRIYSPQMRCSMHAAKTLTRTGAMRRLENGMASTIALQRQLTKYREHLRISFALLHSHAYSHAKFCEGFDHGCAYCHGRLSCNAQLGRFCHGGTPRWQLRIWIDHHRTACSKMRG